MTRAGAAHPRICVRTRTPKEIETLLRVMRAQGCTELEEPDLRLKAARDAKSLRPVAETMFAESAEARPQSYDPEHPPGESEDDDVDPAAMEDDDAAETFLADVVKSAEQRRLKGPRSARAV